MLGQLPFGAHHVSEDRSILSVAKMFLKNQSIIIISAR